MISIIIPCYNQARYLRQAISSALGQSHQPVEVIVVDDGSTENIGPIVSACSGIKYVRQENRGVAAARNTGFRHSHGSYVVFLDGDDRLVPDGVESGLRALTDHPDAAAAVGLCRVIGPCGEAMPFRQQHQVAADAYLELLRGNFIWMPAQVLYRRDAFASVAGFDTTVDACADYDMYLRLARVYRMATHRGVVAEYRQHESNMSGDAVLMLRSALAVLDRQRPYIRQRESYVEAYAVGRRFWKEFYGDQVAEEIRAGVRTPGRRSQAARTAVMLLRYHPGGFLHHLRRKLYRLGAALFARASRA